MNRIIVSVAIIALSASPAFAGKFKIDFVPGQDQSLRLVSGVSAIDSYLPGGSVRIVGGDEWIKKRGGVQLLVINDSEKAFNVGPENVRIRLADGTEVAVLPYERLEKEEKNRRMWRGIAAGLSAASAGMNSANAGYYNTHVNYSSTTTGRYGSYNTFGTANVSGYDPLRAQQAQALANIQNQRTFDNLSSQNQQGREALKANLRTTTIDPGQSFGGVITIELPKSVRGSKLSLPVVIEVTTGSEVHRINAVLAPPKR